MEKILLKNCDKPDSHTIESYIESGGYQGIEKALQLKPDGVIQLVKESGLRGRGVPGFQPV